MDGVLLARVTRNQGQHIQESGRSDILLPLPAQKMQLSSN